MLIGAETYKTCFGEVCRIPPVDRIAHVKSMRMMLLVGWKRSAQGLERSMTRTSLRCIASTVRSIHHSHLHQNCDDATQMTHQGGDHLDTSRRSRLQTCSTAKVEADGDWKGSTTYIAVPMHKDNRRREKYISVTMVLPVSVRTTFPTSCSLRACVHEQRRFFS